MIGKLYTAEGPFVSVYVDSTSAVENARYMYESRWRVVERELESRIDRATADAVVAAAGEHGEGETRVVIASQGAVRLARSLPTAAAGDIVHVGPLPRVAPLVDAASRAVPHVVALVDRTGADLYAYTDADTEVAEFTTVRGDAVDIRKLRGAGGWRMRHMQARAEEGWEHNAKEIADAIERASRDVGARLIVLAGDDREVQLVENDLPNERKEIVARIQGSRGGDGGTDLVFQRVTDEVEARRDKDAIAVLEKFEENRGRNTHASDGLDATVAALRAAQVGTLLLTEDYAGDTQLWFGPEAVQIATTREELLEAGVESPQEAEAIDVLLRAAIATAADVVRVPGGVEQAPTDGVGGLLRFDLAT
jgi:hypothetical protein